MGFAAERPTAAPSVSVRGYSQVAVMAAAVLSLGAAWVHFAYTGSHFREWWAYGLFFLVIAIGQAVFAPAIIRWRWPALALAGIAVNLGVVVMYVWSRTIGVPMGPHQGVAEHTKLPDLATTAAEILLVAVLLTMLPRRWATWLTNLVLLAGIALWVGRLTGTCRDRAPRAGAPARGSRATARCSRSSWSPRWWRSACRRSSPSRSGSRRRAWHRRCTPAITSWSTSWRSASAAPHRGQIAVLREPGSGDLVLKRIVAVGGDVVGIEDGELVVNRRHPAEPYADPASIDSEYFGPVTVPAGAVFVLGDNRANSVDSRDFGVVPVTNLVGRVRARIWPASRWGVAS